MRILGLDIGGAHIKNALLTGGIIKLPARTTYPFEIYRDKDKLPSLLKKIFKKTRPDAVSLTMTGELSDVFPSRRLGVRWITKTVAEAARPAEVKVVDVEGKLVSPAAAMRDWRAVASANWAATVRWVSLFMRDCLVVDIGSTTTDLLAVKNGAPAVSGKTDLERLKSGELVYTGYLRTNAAFVLPEIMIGGARVEMCPEYFAVMGDAHLRLGDIGPKDYTIPGPDGGPKTKRGAAARLARLVLSEPGELGEKAINDIAARIKEAQVERLARAIEKILKAKKLGSVPIVLIGPGRIYRGPLAEKIGNQFVDRAGEAPVSRIDPAACAAALWKVCN